MKKFPSFPWMFENITYWKAKWSRLAIYDPWTCTDHIRCLTILLFELKIQLWNIYWLSFNSLTLERLLLQSPSTRLTLSPPLLSAFVTLHLSAKAKIPYIYCWWKKLQYICCSAQRIRSVSAAACPCKLFLVDLLKTRDEANLQKVVGPLDTLVQL